jgi:Tol biopolymer transport system component/DNA-binding winged helix-turn-helix (wHTH) protein
VTSFQIGEWTVEPSLNQLSRGSERVRVEPKMIQVLEALCEHPGDVVSRDQLVARVWPGVFVSEDALQRIIRELRRVFGDDAARPAYIETIRKRGYRVIARVRSVQGLPDGQSPGGWPSPPRADFALERAAEPPPSEAQPTRTSSWWREALRFVPALALGLAIGAALMLLARSSSIEVASADARFMPLAADAGNEGDPALAPDGRRLAYAMRPEPGAPGNTDIFIRTDEDASPVRLTTDAAEDRLPSWSPDGRTIAFSRLAADGCRLLVVDLETRAERSIGPCANAEEPAVSWSRDGRWLVTSFAPDPLRARGWQIAKVALATGARDLLTLPPPDSVGDHSPRVSPDGGHVAFVRTVGGGVSDVYVVPIDGGAVRRVTSDDGDLQGVDWTANGRALVYASDRAGSYGLWQVPFDGGEPRLLAGGAARLKHPSSSAAGSMVAYESWSYEINLWESDGEGVRPVVRTSEQWNLYPQPSPDGTRVAFVSTRSGSQEVWTAGRDGSSPRQLTRFGRAWLRMPRWSPDGSRLVIAAVVRGEADIFTIDAGDGRVSALTRDAGDELAPSWSADGARVYFAQRVDGVWQVVSSDRTGRDRRVETRDGGYAAQASPDGRWLYFTRADRAGLYRQAVGGAPEPVLPAVSAGSWAGWQLTADSIYVATDGADGRVWLSRATLDGSGLRPWLPLDNFSWPGFAVDRHGLAIYARWDRRESNVMAVVMGR